MGYESKVYVTQKSRNLSIPFYDVVATVDLCKMGWSIYNGKKFRQLFTLPQDGHLFMDDGNTVLKEDAYGDPVEGAPIDEVIDWLEKFTADTDYPRANILLSTLYAVRQGMKWGDLLCFHYGY